MSFLTILGNALVVIAIAVDPYKELRTIPNYLILNLAVCDLFVGPSEVLLGLLHFIPDRHLYLVAYTATYFSMVASALTILTLVFERYIVVAAPLQSKEYLIYSHLKLAIVYIWLIAGCVASLSLLNKCHEKKYRLIVTDAIGIPMMLFMIVIYLRIFYLVRRFIRRDLEDSVGSEQQSLLRSYDQLAEGIRKREKEVAYSVFLFVGVFFLCWAPCFVM
ncbi:beta-2 adrenergic receptor-like [Oculina patagonica]